MTKMLTTRIISDKNEFSSLSDEWNSLLSSSSGADSLFLTHEWISTWLNEVNLDAELFVIAVENGDELVGLAPFYLSRLKFFRLLNRPCLKVLGDLYAGSEYLDLILLPEYESAAIEAITAELNNHRSRWDSIWLPYVATWTGASDRFHKLIDGLNVLTQERSFEFYCIKMPASDDEYWASLTTKLRNNIRRYTKKIEHEAAPIEMRDLVMTLGLDEAMKTILGLHEARWNSVGEEGAFNRRPAFSRFTHAFSKLAAEKGQLAIFGLCQGDEPIGVRFGYIYDKRIFEIQSGYQPHINGCGMVSVDRSIKLAIGLGIKEYDFPAGSSDYKMKFKAMPREGLKIFAGRKTLLNLLIFSKKIWPKGRFIDEGLL